MAAGFRWTQSSVTVTTAGTRVQVHTGTDQAHVFWVMVDNAAVGACYIGLSNVDSNNYIVRLTANGAAFLPYGIPGTTAGMVEMSQFWLDAATDGNIVHCAWI